MVLFSATTISLLKNASSSSSNGVGVNNVVTSLKGNFGRLWRCGHESFTNESRKILSVSGVGATTYLQGLVTSDLLSAPIPPREEVETDGTNEEINNDNETPPLVEFSDKIRSTCFLDNKGRIVTDSLLWKLDETHYLIDVPGNMGDQLLEHLKHFKLRKTKVKLKQETKMSAHVVYGTLNATGTPPGYIAGVDPRHPSLGMRILSLEANNNNNNNNNNLLELMSKQFPEVPGTYDVVRKLAGVAEGIEINGKIAIEANQEFLNAISFHKGCYLGQELTARVHYTGNVRKRIMPIYLIETNIQIPPPWIIASQIQMQQQQQQQNDDINEEVTNQVGGGGNGPRLPRLSPSAAGAIMGMMSGDYTDDDDDDSTTEDAVDSQLLQESPDRSQLRAQADVLMDRLQSKNLLNRGDKIQDTSDGKTIGQIIATPELGTNVVLAQMRLDRVGLLGNTTTWNHTNKVTINDQQYRYLPYLPLWWPTIDRSSGKAVEEMN